MSAPEQGTMPTIIYQHKHAFTAAVNAVQRGEVEGTEAAFFASLGYPGEPLTLDLSLDSFRGTYNSSGFTEDGTYFLQGAIVCSVVAKDHNGRVLTGTFSDPRWKLMFRPEDGWDTIFHWKP